MPGVKTEAGEPAVANAGKTLSAVGAASPGGHLNRILLWVIAIPVALLVAVLLSVTIVPGVLGWQSFVVTSASMTPNIPVGGVVVVRPLLPGEELQAGDVGTFNDSGGELRVTHRVVELKRDAQGKLVEYRTKGDAVRSGDGELRKPDSLVGVVMYTVPLVGWLPYYMNTSGTRTLIIVGIVALLGFSLLRSFLGKPSPAAAVASAPGPAVTMTASPALEEHPSAVGAASHSAAATPAAQPALPVPQPVRRVLGGLAVGVASVAVLVAAAALAPLAWDWHPFMMPDSSMEPAITSGALVMTEPILVFKLQEGDLITFMPARERGKVYVRRVIAKDGDTPGSGVARTKGDNLPAPDAFTLDGTQVVGRVVYTIPYVGGWLSWAGSRQGFMFFGGLIVVLLVGRVVYKARTAPAA